MESQTITSILMNPCRKAACKIIPVIALVACSFHSCNTGESSKTQTGMSPAHIRSAYAIIDPTYNADQLVPGPDISPGAPWLYGPVELESWKHQLMRISSKAVAHHGHYPGVYHIPFARGSFRYTLPAGESDPEMIELMVNGRTEIVYQDEVIYRNESAGGQYVVLLPKGVSGDRVLVVNLKTDAEPPSLLIGTGPFSTDRAGWEWCGGDSIWMPAVAHPPTKSGVLPHQTVIPEILLKPVGQEGVLHDFGRELIGYVTFICDGTPTIIVGESRTEALDTVVSNHEQTLTLVATPSGEWTSKYPLAFRYLQILGDNPREVHCRAQFWPAQYKGAFACSDSLLTRIWMTSAYTHRINKYEFILDGVKRDRLPWIDNMKISSAVEAYTFADPDLIKRTISVLGRESDKSSINNIIDYDALWLISQDAYQLHFDDPVFLRQEWTRIYAMIERIAASCDGNGLRRWPSGSWTFIDWVSGWDKNMAEQVMWWWAQKAGIRLAERMGDQATALKWNARADALEKLLKEKAWDQNLMVWTDPDKLISPTRHANLLSMVSGLTRPSDREGVMRFLSGDSAEPVNSPSMISYEIQTLAEAGKATEALLKLKKIWGAMLQAGATTFWEGYDERETGDEIYRFYDRPYGKSMCHAWGAGPVFLVPEIIFGLKPLEDGWKTFTIDPNCGLVDWAEMTVPSKSGTVGLKLEGKSLTVKIPKGMTCILGERKWIGPGVFSEMVR
jgi:alpha-L-rhamnosidase